MEKLKKQLLYMESVLSFLQYGDALEHEMADTGVVFKLWKDTLKFCQSVRNFSCSLDQWCQLACRNEGLPSSGIELGIGFVTQ